MSAYLSVPNNVAHASVRFTVLLAQVASTLRLIIPVAVPAREELILMTSTTLAGLALINALLATLYSTVLLAIHPFTSRKISVLKQV